MEIKAFIFDLDGTLLDSMPFWRLENRHILREYNYTIDAETEKKLPVETAAFFCRKLEAAGLAGYQESHDLFLSFMTAHYTSDVKPKAGAEKLLKYLKANGIRVYLASATPVSVTEKALEYCGLLKYFDNLFDNTSFGINKSKPEFFERLCDSAGLEAGQCAMFEDSPYALESARKAGLRTFGIFDEVQNRVSGRTDEMKALSEVFVEALDEAIPFI